MKRRKKGEGSFKMTSSGKLAYKFTYTDEYGERKIKSVSGYDEQHCYERAEAFLRNLEKKKKGLYMVTISDILYKCAETDYKMNYTGVQGYNRRVKNIDTIKKSCIGSIPIEKIKKEHIEQFLLSITHYSDSTISKLYSALNLAFRLAVNRKIIKENLMLDRELRVPKSDKPVKKVHGFTDEEQAKFVKAANNYKPQAGRANYRLQLMIELYSGMRMGEINALRPEDIDLKTGILHVRRTITIDENDAPVIKSGTKTPAGQRDIPISNQLRPFLEEALASMKENPDNLIFYNHKRKGPIPTSNVCASYKIICKAAGVPYRGQHALRHTFATRCIEAGIPPIVLKTWLGHTDIHITLDTYADVFDRMNLGAISKLDQYLAEIMEETE